MKITRLFLFHLAVAQIFLLSMPRAAGVDVSESVMGDFPTNVGAPTTLTAGTNSFSGNVRSSSPPDQRDAFAVTIPVGFWLRSVTKNVTGDAAATISATFNSQSLTGVGSGSFSVPTPLPAGTYDGDVTTTSSNGSAWTVVFTVEAVPNYTVSTTGNQIAVTNLTGGSDTLNISQPAAGQIKFSATGRTFSVDIAAAINGDSGTLSLTGKTAITVDPGAGTDTINVSALGGSAVPSLTISCVGNDDTVNLNGDLTFASGKGLAVTAHTVNVAANANLITSGAGAISVTASRNVALASGSSFESVTGDILVQANQQSPATAGNFTGVELNGGMLRSTGQGKITVSGRGGNDTGGFQYGVSLVNGGKTFGGSGAVDVAGTGGASTNWINRGVSIYGAGSAITSDSGNVSVTGTGGALSSSYGIGVSVLFGAEISAGSFGTVTIIATGAGAGGNLNTGLEVGGSPAHINASGGVSIVGSAGPGASFGISVVDSGLISSPTIFGSIVLEADSIQFDASAAISTSSLTGTVTLQTHTSTTRIDLGGADSNTASPKFLGLTVAELDRISAPNLIVASASSAALTISAAINPATITNLTLRGSIQASVTGTDITLPSTGVLTLDGSLACSATSTTPESGYPVLKVVGGVNLNGKPLDLTGTTLPGAIGDRFKIVDNDSNDAITGTFQGLPEGGTIVWPGSPTRYARVSYVGGDGNDVVLTLADALVVVTTSGTNPGSLPGALAAAATNPGADTIAFAPASSGQSMILSSEIIAGDADGVTIDAAGLSGGFTFSGNSVSRIFSVPSGKNLIIKGFGFMLGHGDGSQISGSGGAILNSGNLTLSGCTFYNNSVAADGGAIYNQGTLSMTRCTMNGNFASFSGGAILNTGSLSITHCTIAGNICDFGGGLFNFGFVTLAYSIFSGNRSSFGAGVDIDNHTALTRSGANLVEVYESSGGGSATGPAPISAPALLGSLGSYGGPTTTMPLLPGSPARNAAPGSGTVADQRGFPIFGAPDLGAYEAGTLSTFAIWSIETAGTALAFGTDTDQDGAFNGLEYATRRNPALSDTPLSPTLTGPDGGHVFGFRFRAAATDLRYIVQRSTDLSNVNSWQEIYRFDKTHSTIVRTGVTSVEDFASEVVNITDPTLGTKVFWRLRIEQAP